MEISGAIQTIHTGSEHSPQPRKLCWGSLQTCLISVEPHRGEKSAAPCSVRTDFSGTSLCVFMQFWPAVDLQFFHVCSSFFFQVIQLTMRSKLFTQAITYYHTSDDSASQCSEISFHVCLRTNTLGNHIYITWGFKKKPVTTLLMCLVCAGFCANSESALQGSLCLGLRVTKVYG